MGSRRRFHIPSIRVRFPWIAPHSRGARCQPVPSNGRCCTFALVSALLVMSCNSPQALRAENNDERVHKRVSVKNHETLLRECGRRSIPGAVLRFTKAMNNGELSDQVTSLFVAEADFEWYSVTEGDSRKQGRHIVHYSRNELSRYFAKRHRMHERLQLVELRVKTNRRSLTAHIEFLFRRSANDLEALGISTPFADGKGAIDCRSRKIVAWSMAQNARIPPEGPCPGRRPRRPPLICFPVLRRAAP